MKTAIIWLARLMLVSGGAGTAICLVLGLPAWVVGAGAFACLVALLALWNAYQE